MKTTRIFFLPVLAFFINLSAIAQDTWNVDKAHAKITFSTVHNTISDVHGLFNGFDAYITAAQPDFSDASFTVEIDVASINTEVKMRDDHLRSADFFEVETFPKMTFKGSTLQKTSAPNRYKIHGTMTIKDVTKPLVMDLWYRGTIEDDQGRSIAGFQVTGNLSRFEYNVGNDFPEFLISDEVLIKVDGEFIKE